MPKLPDPSQINRRSPSPGGPSGYIQNANIGTPGADTSVGNALMGIGEDAYKFAMREKARMDEVVLDDAKNQYLTQALDLENEYVQIKGKAAVDQDIVKDYSTKLDSVNEKISSGFKNESQKRAWDRYYGSSKVRFKANVMKHKLIESDTYAAETYKSTNLTRIQNAHSNWADAKVVNKSASDIVENIAKEKVRAGWGEERTEVELKASLGPLWSGIAAQHINAKQYDTAKKILDQHKEVIGVDTYTSYNKSIQESQTIDLSQEHADRIFRTIKGNQAQIDEARKTLSGDIEEETIAQLKSRQNEQKIAESEREKAQSEYDIKWVNEVGIGAIAEGRLTIGMIEDSRLSDMEKARFKEKVYSQISSKKVSDIESKNKNTYAEWSVKVSLKPEKYSKTDLALAVNPTGGGLTAEQYRTLSGELDANKVTAKKTAATEANSKTKSQLVAMYERGDFGKVVTGQDKYKAESWKTFSDILVGYQQKMIDEPNVDHTEWFNKQIEEDFKKRLYKQLDSDWTWGPFRDNSETIITEALKERNLPTTPENIAAVREQYKLDQSGGAQPEMGETGKKIERQKTDYGLRNDGVTKKGPGFFQMTRDDGKTMTEFSVGLNINGEEMDVPSMVPTLTKQERETLRTLGEGEKIPLPILKKAAEHAKMRISEGKSPFYQEGETKKRTVQIYRKPNGQTYYIDANGNQVNVTIKDGKVQF